MKYAELKDGENKIEFYNTFYGKESVIVDGTVLSSKFSITGTTHDFKLASDDYQLSSRYKLFSKRSIDLELTKNGTLIASETKETSRIHRLIWIFMGVLIAYLLFEL